jgi:hypothetical protein
MKEIMMNTVKSMKFLGLGLLSSAFLLASCEKKKKETPAPPVVGKFAITDVQVMGGGMPFSYDAMIGRVSEITPEHNATLISNISLIIGLSPSVDTPKPMVADMLEYFNKYMFNALNSKIEKYYMYDVLKNYDDGTQGKDMIFATIDRIIEKIDVEMEINPVFENTIQPLIGLLLNSFSGEEEQLKKTIIYSRQEQPLSPQESVGGATMLDLLQLATSDIDKQADDLLQVAQNILATLQLEFNKNSEIVILNAESGKPQLDEQIKTEWVSNTEELKKFKIVYNYDAKNPSANVKVLVSMSAKGAGEHVLTIDGVELEWNSLLAILNESIDNNTALDNAAFGDLDMRAYLKDMLLQIKKEDVQFKLLIANVLQLLNLGITLQEVKN